MSSCHTTAHKARRAAKKAKWHAPLIQRKRPAAPFVPNERGFRFEKGAKRARGTNHV